MSSKLKRLKRFVYDYIESIEDAIVFSNTMDTEEISEKITGIRDEIPSRLEEQSFDSDINLIDPKEIENILKKENIVNFIPTSLNDFVSTMFYSKANLSTEEVNCYQKNVEDFQLSQDINYIYDLTFIKNGNENNSNSNSDFKTLLDRTFKDLQVKDKAEFVSNISIFLENYLSTDFGRKKIELINENYQKELANGVDNKKACVDWFQDLIDCVNSSTPKNINLEYNKEKNELKGKTESGGLFDGWYIINQTSYKSLTKEDKEIFDNATTTKELDKLEDSSSSKKQLQISTTTTRGVTLEKDSIVRHALANAVIATTLNEYLELQSDSAFIDSFSKKVIGIEGNSSMRGAIIGAYKGIFGEDFFKGIDIENLDKEGAIKAINRIQKESTEKPGFYIKKLLKRKKEFLSDDIKDKIKKDDLSKEEIEAFMNLDKLNQFGVRNENVWLFKPVTNVSLHYTNKVSSKIESPSISNLEPTEFAMLIQYSALLKMNITNTCHISTTGINEFSKKHIKLTGSSCSLKCNNQLLSDYKINDIDKNIIKTFVLSKNGIENARKLNQGTKESLSKLIESTLNDRDYLEDLNIDINEYAEKVEEMLSVRNPSPLSNSFFSSISSKIDNIKKDKKILEHEKEMLDRDKWINFVSKKIRGTELTEEDSEIFKSLKEYLKENKLNIKDDVELFSLDKEIITEIIKQAEKNNVKEADCGVEYDNPLAESKFHEPEDLENSLKDELEEMDKTPGHLNKERGRRSKYKH
jgi:hypothetical protein